MDLWLIAIQVVGALLSGLSMWLMGDETLWGPLVSFLAGFPFLALYASLGAYFVMPMTLVFMLIDVRNFVKWRREGITWRKR